MDEKTFLAGCERDRIEAQGAMKREQQFTVRWHRFSTNRIWASSSKQQKATPPVPLFDESVQDYKELQAVWPNGRNIQALSLYGQVWDFFGFMWRRTRPYKAVALARALGVESTGANGGH